MPVGDRRTQALRTAAGDGIGARCSITPVLFRGPEGIPHSAADVLSEFHSAQLEAAGEAEEKLAAFVPCLGRALVTIDEREDGIFHARLARR